MTSVARLFPQAVCVAHRKGVQKTEGWRGFVKGMRPLRLFVWFGFVPLGLWRRKDSKAV